MDFNPRAPCGARPAPANAASAAERFQSTRPMRGATEDMREPTGGPHISIHAPHAGRDMVRIRDVLAGSISIHAPHAGRDVGWCNGSTQGSISIHAPHAGRDYQSARSNAPGALFQSTRPMRGATGPGWIGSGTHSYFNPRAPCGARRCHGAANAAHPVFQSTRPMRGATLPVILDPLPLQFQSTRPMRGATWTILATVSSSSISIHAPHAGRDISIGVVVEL